MARAVSRKRGGRKTSARKSPVRRITKLSRKSPVRRITKLSRKSRVVGRRSSKRVIPVRAPRRRR